MLVFKIIRYAIESVFIYNNLTHNYSITDAVEALNAITVYLTKYDSNGK